MACRSRITARLIGLALAAALAARAGAAASWVEGSRAHRSIADLSPTPAVSLLPDHEARMLLVRPVSFRGALYDALVTGPEPGTVRLLWTDGGARDDSEGLLIRAGGRSLRVGPQTVEQVRQEDGGLLAVRFVRLLDPAGEPVSFDVLVEPSGARSEARADVVVQWLQVPASLALQNAAVEITDLSRPDASARPVAEGFSLRSGAVVVLPGDQPWNMPSVPMTGCGVADQTWCEVVRAYRPACITPNHGDETACSVTQAKRWHFNEGAFCQSCPYTFYVTVECGTEMHLPFKDMEGNQISITDVFTGTRLELEAINECARTPFRYCNNCALNGGTPVPDPAGTLCPDPPPPQPSNHVDCTPYLQRSTLVQWGWPMQDLDGDGVFDDLPCGPPNTDGCNGNRSGSNLAHEEQSTDVVLHGGPALCGVFRIDIVAGGYHWFLSANCNGIVPDDPAEIERNFNIYQNCSDALAAFDPVPELAITKLEFTGVCPDIELLVEVTNLGCIDAPSSPVHLAFSRANQGDLDVDLGVVAAGTSVVQRIPVSLVATPQDVTASVDPSNVISECTEQAAGSFSGCQPTSGADSLTATLCSCANTVSAALQDNRLVACNGQSAAVDASGSSAVPCVGGTLEYRVRDASGATVRDWLTAPVAWLTPTRCPSIDSYDMQVRCSLETAPDCIRTIPFTVECAEAPALVVTSSASPVCAGDPVSVTATPGFGSYVWDDGRVGTVINDRPGATTTYRVTATTAAGCVAQGQVTVDVMPDPVPGPLGASLRVKKTGNDVLFTYAELGVPVGAYELVLHQDEGTVAPCANREPPTKPTPIAMNAAPVIDTAAPGDPAPQLVHVNGVNTCPKLLFYKVVATSPCRGIRGTACNGWPRQLLPCP